MWPKALNLLRQSAMRLALIGAVLLCTLAPPRAALAWQDEEFDFNERMNTLEIPVEPPLIKAQVVSEIAKALGLDQSQTDLVAALHQGYVVQFTDAATAHRDRLKALMDEMQELGGFNMGGDNMEDMARIGMDMQAAQRQWMERRQQVGQDFFENVKATLTPEQLAGWARFERDRRRRTLLHVGAFFAGESVDVIELVDDLELEPEQRGGVDPLLDSYATELDGLLQQRIRAAEEVRNIDYMNAGAEGDMFEKFERILSVRRQIRDVNRKHAQVVATAMPGPASDRLTRAFRESCYPRIYAPTQADEYISQVLGFEDLSDDQRRGIEGIAAIYRDEVATANNAMARLLGEQEDSIDKALKQSDIMMLAMVGGMAAFADEAVSAEQMPFDAKDLLMDEQQQQKQDDLYRQKRGYVVAAIEQIAAVLNPAQQDRAPKPDVPEETEQQKALRQIRSMLRQTMQFSEDMAREAEQEREGANPGR
ncbi:MAG: hypothetical protein IT430_06765 [Phycisphaerales bacterium]|nr:hypothetical protein [Phycisphaerales bacterium]